MEDTGNISFATPGKTSSAGENAKNMTSSILFKNNPETVVNNAIITCRNYLSDVKNIVSFNCNEIENDTDGHLEDLKNEIKKAQKSNEIFKETEKYSLDLMYVEGEIQYIKMQIEKYEEKLHEMEQIIQDISNKIIELERDRDVARQSIVDKHNSFKIATKYYKTNLDFYLHVEKKENVFHVTMCYFTQKFDDTYSCVISKNDNEDKWTLNSVQPKLEERQFLALQDRFNKFNNMAALSCTLRKILMLYKKSGK